MVEVSLLGRGGDQLDPCRCLREDDAGLERPQNWSLTPGKQVRDVGIVEPFRLGFSSQLQKDEPMIKFQVQKTKVTPSKL